MISAFFRHSLILLFSFLPSVCFAKTIWIEAENTTDATVLYDKWYDTADSSLLSGGKWLSHLGATPGTVRFSFTASAPGPYKLWLRINPKDSIIRLKLNDSSWQSLSSFDSAYDEINVAGDKKDDFRYLAWANVGQYILVPGVNTITFEFASKNKNHGALDCFCFSNDPQYLPTKSFKQPLQAQPVFQVPRVDEGSFDDWIKFIEPSPSEMMWRTHIRWHSSLADAVVEAKRLQRPILLWTMNGHPCGET